MCFLKIKAFSVGIVKRYRYVVFCSYSIRNDLCFMYFFSPFTCIIHSAVLGLTWPQLDTSHDVATGRHLPLAETSGHCPQQGPALPGTQEIFLE